MKRAVVAINEHACTKAIGRFSSESEFSTCCSFHAIHAFVSISASHHVWDCIHCSSISKSSFLTAVVSAEGSFKVHGPEKMKEGREGEIDCWAFFRQGPTRVSGVKSTIADKDSSRDRLSWNHQGTQPGMDGGSIRSSTPATHSDQHPDRYGRWH